MGFTGNKMADGLLDIGLGQINQQQQWRRQDKVSAEQYGRSQEMMGQQQMNQMALNKQGHGLQMDMWNKTNYGAQKEHMENAGLNPALMYGIGGGGGTTAGSQGGGSASGGHAAQAPKTDMNAMMMGAQMSLMEAQASKAGAEAEKIKGVDTQGAIAEMNNKLQDIEKKKIGIEIDKATKESEIKRIKREGLNKGLEGELQQANINLTKVQKEAVEHAIWQKWSKLGLDTVSNFMAIVGGKKALMGLVKGLNGKGIGKMKQTSENTVEW